MQASGLTARELCCRRGDRWLFHGLDLALAPGDALHLMGANGAGKSSLLRILAGLAPPSPTLLPKGAARVGTITWEGRVAMIDERLALDPGQPLGKALNFWARIDGVSPDDAAAHAERLGIATLMDVPVAYLSTGQKKRAGLARLLGQNAGNWLLDEPLNGLDVAGVALIETLIAEHRARGGTAIVTSHQPLRLPDAAILDLSRPTANRALPSNAEPQP